MRDLPSSEDAWGGPDLALLVKFWFCGEKEKL
jgi:hypothetical protein